MVGTASVLRGFKIRLDPSIRTSMRYDSLKQCSSKCFEHKRGFFGKDVLPIAWIHAWCVFLSFDFEAINLADSWKRWRQEVELYMDLAMCAREESKLFLYLLGSQEREICSTMRFEAPGHERNLKQVMDAFDRHCIPKKNEAVERYKFFSRFQNSGESLETFITDLASTCNFGDLKDSLVRDRFICGIKDK